METHNAEEVVSVLDEEEKWGEQSLLPLEFAPEDQCLLSAEHQAKISGLLREPKHTGPNPCGPFFDAGYNERVKLAFFLLKSLGATCADWIQLVIPKLDELTKWQTLGFVQRIEREFGECIARFFGDLELEGIETIDYEEARYLSRHSGELSLPNLKELTEDCAERFESHIGGLSLPKITEISDASAMHLSKRPWGGLEIGLTTLTDESARWLAKSNPGLTMYMLQTLSDTGIFEFIKRPYFHQDFIFLPPFNCLTPEIARAVAKHEDGNNYLSGINHLTPSCAFELCQFEYLDLISLVDLDEDTARVFAEHHKGYLMLGTESLAPGVAEILKGHVGFINFARLLEVDRETLEVLDSFEYLPILQKEILDQLFEQTTYLGDGHYQQINNLLEKSGKEAIPWTWHLMDEYGAGRGDWIRVYSRFWDEEEKGVVDLSMLPEIHPLFVECLIIHIDEDGDWTYALDGIQNLDTKTAICLCRLMVFRRNRVTFSLKGLTQINRALGSYLIKCNIELELGTPQVNQEVYDLLSKADNIRYEKLIL